MTSRFIVGCLLLSFGSGSIPAQLDLNGANAILRIDSLIPHVEDAVDHDVIIGIPNSTMVEVLSGPSPSQPLILLASLADPSGPVFPVPWDGSIDVGSFDFATNSIVGVSLLGDGIGLSHNPLLDAFYVTGPNPNAHFVFPLVVGNSADGLRVAFQAIVRDPTQGPFFLDNTEAGDANFKLLQRQIISIPSGASAVSFLPGQVFNFHGQSYTGLNVYVRGYVTFGGQSSFNPNFTVPHANWVSDVPSIAAHLSDWDPINGVAGNGILYEEFLGQARISWGDPQAQTSGGMAHFGEDDLNRFEIVLELADGANADEGKFAINFPLLDRRSRLYPEGTTGHTPGAAIIAGAFDRNLHQPQSGGPREAMVEEHDLIGNGSTILGWDGNGALRGYNNFTRSWDGGGIEFSPLPTAGITGGAGYDSVSTGPPPPDHVQWIPVPRLTAGSSVILTVPGSFSGFDPDGDGSGKVEFDCDGLYGGPFDAIVQGIMDASGSSGPLSLANPLGPHRDAQAIVLATPVLSETGIYTVRFVFDSGYEQFAHLTVEGGTVSTLTTIPVPINSSPISLGVPVVYGGVTYNQIFVSQFGVISMGAAFPILFNDEASFFGLANTAPVPAVTPGWAFFGGSGFFGGGAVDVVENPVTGTVQVGFMNIFHGFTNGLPAGSLVSTLGSVGANSVSFDHRAYRESALSGDDLIVGVTDGDENIGSDTSLTNGSGTGILNLLGLFQSSSAPDSIAETFAPGQPLGFTSPINFIDLTGNFNWIFF